VNREQLPIMISLKKFPLTLPKQTLATIYRCFSETL